MESKTKIEDVLWIGFVFRLQGRLGGIGCNLNPYLFIRVVSGVSDKGHVTAYDLFVYLSLDLSSDQLGPWFFAVFFGGMEFSSGDKKLPSYIGTFL